MWHRSGVDLDAFQAVREPRWARLRELSRKRSRSGAEVDEMTRLYRSTAADLSAVRSAAPEPSVIARLSMLLGSSRVWLTGSRGLSATNVRDYFTSVLPASLYLVRWWAVGYSLAVVGLGAINAVYLLSNPENLDLIATPEERSRIANESFASYYTEYDNTSFTALVWTNNAWLAVQCLAFGITLVRPLVLGFMTALQLGTNAAIMSEAGMLDVFFKLILPHGLLELSAAFLAAGAGIHMAWRLVVPERNLTRMEGLARAFRTLMSAALGVTLALLISGIIEGFITPSGLPWLVKDSIGVLACIAFWGYVFVAGRMAVRRGVTGDVDQELRVESARVAA